MMLNFTIKFSIFWRNRERKEWEEHVNCPRITRIDTNEVSFFSLVSRKADDECYHTAETAALIFTAIKNAVFAVKILF